MTLAALLTLARVFLIPVIFWAYHSGRYGLSLALFLLASLTDLADGRIARALDQVTPLGALLDPVADKAVELSFSYFFYTRSLLPGWFVGLVFLRNVSQLLSIPVLMWIMKIQFKVKPNFPAKLGTAVGFTILLMCFSISLPGLSAGPRLRSLLWVFISVSAPLEIYILTAYLPRFYQIATGRHDTFE